jgi:hypothetical protein
VCCGIFHFFSSPFETPEGGRQKINSENVNNFSGSGKSEATNKLRKFDRENAKSNINQFDQFSLSITWAIFSFAVLCCWLDLGGRGNRDLLNTKTRWKTGKREDLRLIEVIHSAFDGEEKKISWYLWGICRQ